MKKFIFQPIKPYIVTQKFGENRACVSTDGKNRVISCNGFSPPPGFKSLYGSEGHLGTDLVAYHGQPIYSATEGIVEHIDTKEKSGLDVRIRTEFEGEQFLFIYEHLLGYQPKKGDKVEVGDLIGWADNTGYSSGDHLHWQVMKLVQGNWVAIDPTPYMESMFALDFAGLWRKMKEILAVFADFMAERMRVTKRPQ